MKTHEFADALILVARMLKAGRNVELKDWPGPIVPADQSADSDGAAEIGLSLGVLARLSRFNKGQWRTLLAEWQLPVEIRNSDSVRDLIGRVLGYLAEHPDAIRRIRTESTKKSPTASPELLRALSILLGENGGEGADELP